MLEGTFSEVLVHIVFHCNDNQFENNLSKCGMKKIPIIAKDSLYGKSR